MPADPLLRVRKLSKTYFRRRWLAPPLPATAALAGVSFTLDRGRTLAVIGASGSGKSTLARCLTQFEIPTGGEILFEGRPLSPERRLDIQLIFQQPAASLNSRFTAAAPPSGAARPGGGSPCPPRPQTRRGRPPAPGHRARPRRRAQAAHPRRVLQRTRCLARRPGRHPSHRSPGTPGDRLYPDFP